MRRISMLTPLLVFVLAGFVAVGRAAPASLAQEATPLTESVFLPPAAALEAV